MIKILKEGELHKTYKILFTVKCDNCGCEFEFEEEDFTKIEKHINGNYFIKCPYCKYEIVGKYAHFNPRIIDLDMEGEKE